MQHITNDKQILMLTQNLAEQHQEANFFSHSFRHPSHNLFQHVQ